MTLSLIPWSGLWNWLEMIGNLEQYLDASCNRSWKGGFVTTRLIGPCGKLTPVDLDFILPLYGKTCKAALALCN